MTPAEVDAEIAALYAESNSVDRELASNWQLHGDFIDLLRVLVAAGHDCRALLEEQEALTPEHVAARLRWKEQRRRLDLAAARYRALHDEPRTLH